MSQSIVQTTDESYRKQIALKANFLTDLFLVESQNLFKTFQSKKRYFNTNNKNDNKDVSTLYR
jgi:hypothetical protein